MTHAHAHRHGFAAQARVLSRTALGAGLFALVELAGGWWANSLALMADAAHMASDVAALLLAAAAARIAARPPHPGMSYGYGRAATMAAQANGLGLWFLAGWIAWEAVGRLHEPPEVAGGTALAVACVGLVVNLAMLAHLHGGREHLNVRAAFWHVLGDLLGSVAAIVSALAIWRWHLVLADPIASLVIVAILAWGGWGLVREATRELMMAAPAHLDPEAVAAALAAHPAVRGVHHLHLWGLPDGRAAASAHVEIADMDAWPRILPELLARLAEAGVEHATLQPEERPDDHCADCEGLA